MITSFGLVLISCGLRGLCRHPSNHNQTFNRKLKSMANEDQFPCFIEGQVVKGYGRGSRELACPTANIEKSVVNLVNLSNGVFYGFAQLLPTTKSDSIQTNSPDSQVFMCCTNVGYCPQYGNSQRSIEAYIFNDFGRDFYDEHLKIALCAKIRNEMVFKSIDELKIQIHNDLETTRIALEVDKQFEDMRNSPFFRLSN